MRKLSALLPFKFTKPSLEPDSFIEVNITYRNSAQEKSPGCSIRHRNKERHATCNSLVNNLRLRYSKSDYTDYYLTDTKSLAVLKDWITHVYNLATKCLLNLASMWNYLIAIWQKNNLKINPIMCCKDLEHNKTRASQIGNQGFSSDKLILYSTIKH